MIPDRVGILGISLGSVVAFDLTAYSTIIKVNVVGKISFLLDAVILWIDSDQTDCQSLVTVWCPVDLVAVRREGPGGLIAT